MINNDIAVDVFAPISDIITGEVRLQFNGEVFRNFIDGAIYFVVSVVPVFLLYLLGVYIVYRIGKMMYRGLRQRV